MLYKLFTHISIKHYVRHMTNEHIKHFLIAYESIQHRSRGNNDFSIKVAFNLMTIFKPYISKELKRRK